MKSPIPHSAFVFLALTGAALAAVPTKASPYWQGPLVTRSPFTSPPLVTKDVPAPNALETYGLLGVSSIGNDGYRVTLVHKDKPGERIIVDSNKSENGFKILGVNRVTGDPSATVVRLQFGAESGTVAFDPKLTAIAAKKPVAPKPAEAPADVPRAGRIRVLPPTR